MQEKNDNNINKNDIFDKPLTIGNNNNLELKEKFQEEQAQYNKKHKIKISRNGIQNVPKGGNVIIRILGTIAIVHIAITIVMYILTWTGCYVCMAI